MIDIFITSVSLLIKWNILISLAAASLVAFGYYNRRARVLDFTAMQTIHRLALLTALLAPPLATLASFVFTPKNLFAPSVQIAASPSIGSSGGLTNNLPRLSIATFPSSATANSETLWLGIAAALILAVTFVYATYRLIKLWRDHKKLIKLASGGFIIRKLGRVRLIVSNAITTPFAARLQGQAAVFLPQSVLSNWSQFKIVVRHELQHHRQGDLLWNFLVETIRVLCGWNPLVRYWLANIEENDEFACDEALLGRKHFGSLAYATCLFEVAKAVQSTRGKTIKLTGTAGMAVSPHFLKRRIEMTFANKQRSSQLVKLAVGLAVIVSTTFAAWAGEGIIRDRRIDRNQAMRLASRAQSQTGIPIVINGRVLYWLNEIVGNPRARFWMRNTLKRMKTHEPMIAAKLTAANVTQDLLAVPAVESGYQNTETVTAAGLWQFVPQTARNYGLRVDDELDERLSPELETIAAIAYLTRLAKIFEGDWHLALLSYNVGERRVQEIVKEAGHRDVFRFADEGRLKKGENENYVPKLLAALIILKNPELVRD